MQIHKTVFISYRRTSTPIARTVYDKLTAQGFDVFFDLKSITNGDFEQTILTQIANRAHFVLILTPSTLERCVSSDDWVRREIEEAMKLKRNIVPLFFEGFDYSNEKNHLKGDFLSILPNYNGLRVPWDFFDEAMVRVERDFLNEPLETVLHPVSKQKQAEVAEIKEEIEEEHVTPEQLKAQEYFEKGNVKYYKSNHQGAIDEYTRAILFDGNFSNAYHNRGATYDDLGNHDKAISDYNKAIELNPEFVTTYYNRGSTYRNLGKYEQAISDFDRAIALNPYYANAYYNRGFAYRKLEMYDKAIPECDRAIALNPEFVRAYYIRGFAYYQLKNYEQAVSDFERVVALDPNDENAKEWLEIAEKKANNKGIWGLFS